MLCYDIIIFERHPVKLLFYFEIQHKLAADLSESTRDDQREDLGFHLLRSGYII